MKNTGTKKLILALVFAGFIMAISAVMADGQVTPTESMYHTPTDTGIGDALDSTILIGAVLYGIGVLMTSGAKVISAKFGGLKLLK